MTRATLIAYGALLAIGIAAGIMLTGCHLGPRGRAAVAASTLIRTVDAGCRTLLASIPAHVERAVADCAGGLDPVGCYSARVKSRQDAVSACGLYSQAREHGGDAIEAGRAAQAALSAISTPPQ